MLIWCSSNNDNNTLQNIKNSNINNNGHDDYDHDYKGDNHNENKTNYYLRNAGMTTGTTGCSERWARSTLRTTTRRASRGPPLMLAVGLLRTLKKIKIFLSYKNVSSEQGLQSSRVQES